MTQGMEWEAPPPVTAFDWWEVARTLQDHPGEWLKVFDDGPVSVINSIRQSSVGPLTPLYRPSHPEIGGYEVTTRNNVVGPPRTATLYLRWVPEGEGEG